MQILLWFTLYYHYSVYHVLFVCSPISCSNVVYDAICIEMFVAMLNFCHKKQSNTELLLTHIYPPDTMKINVFIQLQNK